MVKQEREKMVRDEVYFVCRYSEKEEEEEEIAILSQ